MAIPAARQSAADISCPVTRTATVALPPVIQGGAAADAVQTHVTGPGQVASIRASSCSPGSMKGLRRE
jgi:hypothetical protein